MDLAIGTAIEAEVGVLVAKGRSVADADVEQRRSIGLDGDAEAVSGVLEVADVTVA